MQIQADTASNIQLSDDEIAAKLVRIPKQSGSTIGAGPSGPSGTSFSKNLQDALGSRDVPSALVKKGEKDDKRLWDACIEMESLLVGKMLKEMRNTVEKSGWIDGGFAEEVFQDMLYDEYSMSLSRNSNLGLAKSLYKELTRRA